MELFGIGPLELLFIMIIALVVLGPRDMVKAGRSIGRFLRKTILSPTWLKMQREIRNIPYQMMREAGLEEEDLRIKADIEKAYRGGPAQTSSIPAGEMKSETTQTQADRSDESLPIVPPEWLGLPANVISPSDGKPAADEPQSLDAWTSAPATAAAGPDPKQDQDSN
jgi:sec-independent protein translocase protein TatB